MYFHKDIQVGMEEVDMEVEVGMEVVMDQHFHQI